ncbi:Arc family DNA-binding protein [Proteus mirabilis]|uniref:Arc family DNA-binding protein n=1 Tax=Proteus mirabilis TaxID=584 RepID=UPI003D010EC8
MRTYLICMRTTYNRIQGRVMKKSKPSTVRFPEEIRELLEFLAKKNDRTFSKEIVSRIRRTLEEDGLAC